jgi:hypothetical protein
MRLRLATAQPGIQLNLTAVGCQAGVCAQAALGRPSAAHSGGRCLCLLSWPCWLLQLPLKLQMA